ncbi:MAG: phosphoribosyl-AMP cyclohydrolase [Lentisphaerae bacterium RIFOXYB12_FULL_65_16]|nr:MAG: phosphoribosyl-AMP cyclohydrolase [Lentisphaerae bacterium RIFOXYA12_64_32]OGV93838.1 MAG: phosphoribosyl-AMP cyclohydrolase [Lentisphaerae bacterium RIFOXYB12_FULL_65_16]
MIKLEFSKSPDGLIPVIAQDWRTNEVLMLAYMNEAAWQKTLDTGLATYWSRSRQKYWVKGESSGHVQNIKEICVDCDCDTVLLKVEQVGDAACHEGYRSCFYRKVTGDDLEVTGKRLFTPEELYKKK